MSNVLQIILCIFIAFGKQEDNIMGHLENKARAMEYITGQSNP